MAQQATRDNDGLAQCARQARGMVALGALLAGCDRCGDWWWSSPGRDDAQVCRNAGPKPR